MEGVGSKRTGSFLQRFPLVSLLYYLSFLERTVTCLGKDARRERVLEKNDLVAGIHIKKACMIKYETEREDSNLANVEEIRLKSYDSINHR